MNTDSRMTVNHAVYGKGFVTKIDTKNKAIVADFGDYDIRSLSVMLFDSGKVTTTDEVISKAVNKFRRSIAKKNPNIRKIHGVTYGMDSFFEGTVAQDIDSCSDEDFYEAIGYIAKNVSAIEVQIAEFKVEAFEEMFGKGINPYIHKSGDIGSRFRICFERTENIPKILEDCLSEDGRITKSLFIEKLIKFFGFKFGTEQNVEEIRKIAVSNGFETEFTRGYNR